MIQRVTGFLIVATALSTSAHAVTKKQLATKIDQTSGKVTQVSSQVSEGFSAQAAAVARLEAAAARLEAIAKQQDHLWAKKIVGAERFEVLADFEGKAVLDRETGLVWEKTPSTNTQWWYYALGSCAHKIISNRGGWRMASWEELMTLLDKSVTVGNRLPPGNPFEIGNSSDVFGGASTDMIYALPGNGGRTDLTMGVRFSDGMTASGLAKDISQFRAWCVRGQSPSGMDYQK